MPIHARTVLLGGPVGQSEWERVNEGLFSRRGTTVDSAPPLLRLIALPSAVEKSRQATTVDSAPLLCSQVPRLT